MAAWKSFESWSSCVRLRFSTGVRSPPPPNQPFDVTTMRVFMWPVGALGFVGCAMKDMPLAQKRGSSSAPGICLANSLGNSPMHGGGMAADLLEHAARHQGHHAAAALFAGPWRAGEAAGGLALAAGRAFGRVLDGLEGRQHPVAQGLEPALRPILVGLEVIALTQAGLFVCLHVHWLFGGDAIGASSTIPIPASLAEWHRVKSALALTGINSGRAFRLRA